MKTISAIGGAVLFMMIAAGCHRLHTPYQPLPLSAPSGLIEVRFKAKGIE